MSSKRNVLIFLIVIFILGVSLRLFQLGFFEFKDDQLLAIQKGVETRELHFMVTHGLGSGVGINNPPFFVWFMGLLTSVSVDPFVLTMFFCLLNIFAFLWFGKYLYDNLPYEFCLLSASWLAFSPAFVMYSNIIWAQCLLPIICVVFFINLVQFIKNQSFRSFSFLVIASVFASQLHMSGFFLFPVCGLLVLSFRPKWEIKLWIGLGLMVGILFAPYVYHLLKEGELIRAVSVMGESGKHIYCKIFRQHIWLVSADFLRYYSGKDFMRILAKQAGGLVVCLYPFTWFFVASFVFSFCLYLKQLITRRLFFVFDEHYCKQVPLIVQAAGYMALVVTAGFLISKIQTPPHYLIILFPAYAVMAVYGIAYSIKYMFVKIIAIASCVALLLLTFTSLLFFKNAGGHYREYGMNYEFLSAIKKNVVQSIQTGEIPVFSVSYTGEGKFDTDAISHVLNSNMKTGTVVAVTVDIIWNKQSMKYEYSIK